MGGLRSDFNGTAGLAASNDVTLPGGATSSTHDLLAGLGRLIRLLVCKQVLDELSVEVTRYPSSPAQRVEELVILMYLRDVNGFLAILLPFSPTPFNLFGRTE